MPDYPVDPTINVTVLIEPPLTMSQGEVPDWEGNSTTVSLEILPTVAHIEDLIRYTLYAERVAGPLEVTVVVSDDETLRDLNHRFRGIDAPTDVLSFAEPTETNGFVLPPDMPRYLGDIVISYPRVVAQAVRHGHSPREELDLLIVHGCLHLVGYEDETEAGTETMWAIQEEILKAVRTREASLRSA